MKLQKVDGNANEYRLTDIEYMDSATEWAVKHLGGCSIDPIRERDKDGDMATVGYSFISRSEITQESLQRAIACDYEMHKLKEQVEKLKKHVFPSVPLDWAGMFSFHYGRKEEDEHLLVDRVAALESRPKPWWKVW